MTAELEERDHHVRSSEATLRLVTDNLPAMIGYWDAGLRNRFANANYRRWLGMSDADIQGRQLEDLLSPEQFAEDKLFIDAALAGRRAARRRRSRRAWWPSNVAPTSAARFVSPPRFAACSA